MTTIRETQAAVHQLAREKGWWDNNVHPDDRPGSALWVNTSELLEKLCLVHSEVSEATEEARVTEPEPGIIGAIRYRESDGKPEGFGIELADAVIRIMDLCGALGIDLEEAIRIKHKFNMTRPQRHGGKLA
jgi:NTP pyrophosphatase (non-canonical NTP hydrolase)